MVVQSLPGRRRRRHSPSIMPLPDAYHRLFDASPNPYLVLDRQLNIVTANRAYLASTGRTLADIVGRWAWDAFPTDPETLRQAIASFEHVIRTRETDTMALLRFDIPRPAADGGGFETRYWTITHTPVLDAAGEVDMVMQNAIDVTDIERMREGARLADDEHAALAAGQAGLIDRARQAFEANLDLKADLARLEALFQKAPSFMAVLRGPEHVFEFANDAMHRLFGQRDYIGRPVRDALPEFEGQRVFETLDWVRGHGEPFVGFGLPVRVLTDGADAQRHMDLLYQPIVEEGAVAGILVVGADVTEQHVARATVEAQVLRLQRAEHLLAFQLELADRLRPLTAADEMIAAASRLLGERLDVARVVFAEIAAPSMQVTVRHDWCRPGLVSIAGIETTLDQFGPGTADDLRAGRDVLVHDAYADARTQANLAAYAAIGVRAHLTIPLMTAGRLQVVLSLHDTLPRDWMADELRMAHDMAARTWTAVETAGAQALLGQTAAQLRFTLDSAQLGDWDLDLVTRTSRRSPLHDRCFGYTEPVAQWSHAIFLDHVHPDDRARVEQTFHDALVQDTVWRIETRVIWPDASVHWLSIFGTVYLAGGKAQRMAGIVFDISERKRIEEQLRLEAHRKDEFLAMLAHELRNPLAPIGAAADLLAMGRLDAARVSRTSAIITRQVGHMTSLIDDLLDVSRVTRGLVTLESVPVDVKATIADAVEQVRPLVEARRHRLEVQLAPDQAVVLGDRKRLVQVLANLLGNAAKYTPEGGRIGLHLEVDETADGGRVTLCVIDNGIGMTPDVRRGAFELFTQAERTPDRSQGGLGIGLALVKSLVELHRGTVTAYSDGPGRGSRFIVRLPRAAAADSAPANQVQHGLLAAAEGMGAGTRQVLVVDDNVDAAQLLALVLENVGYQVRVEHAPRAALEVARSTPPAVCILDIGLPDMDGNELARRLRALPGMAGALLIALTGYGRPQDRAAALAAGFDHHLVKPVDVHQLVKLLG
jgi:PAS domain S-box-containing protein